jgi:hypothetical protein
MTQRKARPARAAAVLRAAAQYHSDEAESWERYAEAAGREGVKRARAWARLHRQWQRAIEGAANNSSTGQEPALVLPLDPQPDMIPFQIVGDRSGRWYNERKRHRRTGRGPMLIAWRPPTRQHVPAQHGETWVWQNASVTGAARPRTVDAVLGSESKWQSR